MAIRVRCSHCETSNSFADTLAGKKVRCKKCQGIMAVPQAEVEDVTEALAAPPAQKAEVPKSKTRPAAVRDEEDELRQERPSRPAKAKSSTPLRSRVMPKILALTIVAIVLGMLGGMLLAMPMSYRTVGRTEQIDIPTGTMVKTTYSKEPKILPFGIGIGLAGLAGVAAVAAPLLTLVWLARAWRAIPQEQGGMSAGKAVGLLFVPLFNLYWMFRVIPGLSTALTQTLQSREPSRSFRAGYGAGLTACILSLIPCLNVFALVPFLMWLSSADQAVIRLAAEEGPPRPKRRPEEEGEGPSREEKTREEK